MHIIFRWPKALVEKLQNAFCVCMCTCMYPFIMFLHQPFCVTIFTENIYGNENMSVKILASF